MSVGEICTDLDHMHNLWHCDEKDYVHNKLVKEKVEELYNEYRKEVKEKDDMIIKLSEALKDMICQLPCDDNCKICRSSCTSLKMRQLIREAKGVVK